MFENTQGLPVQITKYTVAFCMVAAGQLVLHIDTFVKLAIRALKYTTFNDFDACGHCRV
jgi:hypothetical protein